MKRFRTKRSKRAFKKGTRSHWKNSMDARNYRGGIRL